MLLLQSNAAGGRRMTAAAEMQKDRAAASADARPHVPVEDADDVVEVVAAPHALVAGGGGEADRTIVAPARRILAPAVVGSHRTRRDFLRRRRDAVRAIIEAQEPIAAGRRGAVAFALQSRHA